MPMHRALLFLCALLLGGCSAISALDDAGRPLEVVDLRAPDGLTAIRTTRSRGLVVELPETGGALDTDRIMIRPSPLSAQYLPDVRWSDTTPVMLQTLMVRSFENTEGLRYVGRRPIGPDGDVALISELTHFEAEQTGEDTARITLRLIARLVREEDAEILATRIFRAGVDVPSTETDALLQGFDRAADMVLTELTGWTMGTLGIGLREAEVARLSE